MCCTNHSSPLQAELTGVSELTWPQNHRWCIDIQESGSSETREGVYVSNEEQHDLQGSRCESVDAKPRSFQDLVLKISPILPRELRRGTANFVVRFGGRGSKEAYCQVEQAPSNSMCKAAYTAEDSGSWVPILVLECRGLEPVKWVPQGGFTVVSSGVSASRSRSQSPGVCLLHGCLFAP